MSLCPTKIGIGQTFDLACLKTYLTLCIHAVHTWHHMECEVLPDVTGFIEEMGHILESTHHIKRSILLKHGGIGGIRVIQHDAVLYGQACVVFVAVAATLGGVAWGRRGIISRAGDRWVWRYRRDLHNLLEVCLKPAHCNGSAAWVDGTLVKL